MVDSENIFIEAFRINAGGHGELEEFKNSGESLLVKTIGVSIPVAEIYEGTKLLMP